MAKLVGITSYLTAHDVEIRALRVEKLRIERELLPILYEAEWAWCEGGQREGTVEHIRYARAQSWFAWAVGDHNLSLAKAYRSFAYSRALRVCACAFGKEGDKDTFLTLFEGKEQIP